MEGKGREDLNYDILLAAESIIRRISSTQSRSVRYIAEKIKSSFNDFRQLMKKYDENIEIVDPQLKNNPDLVECISKYENFWEKGNLVTKEKTICLMKENVRS